MSQGLVGHHLGGVFMSTNHFEAFPPLIKTHIEMAPAAEHLALAHPCASMLRPALEVFGIKKWHELDVLPGRVAKQKIESFSGMEVFSGMSWKLIGAK